LKAGYIITNFPSSIKSNPSFVLKCFTYLINDPVYGIILFDTGSPYKPETILHSLKNEFDIFPEDVKWIFNTHIHPDHVGANSFFPKAKIIFSKKDFDFAKETSEIVFSNGDLMSFLHSKCPGYKNSFDEYETNNMKNLIKLYWNEEKIGLKKKPSFIEDNPEIPQFIKIFLSSGHTFFHYSFIIENNYKNIFVTGDAISNRFVLNGSMNTRLLEPHMDFDMYFNTIKYFEKIDGIFFPGHDRPYFSKSKQKIRSNYFNIYDLKDYIVD
jgi:glyoxylase-like metal-dependent hydrolase (beta-lactamase superfamily II)